VGADGIDRHRSTDSVCERRQPAAGASRSEAAGISYALGAGQRHITAAILLECLLLGLAGSVLGLALAFAALRILVAMAPKGLPRLHEITIDAPALLFTVGIALLVSFGIGMIPVIKYTRADLRGALSESGRGQSQSRERQRARKVLVAVQVALSLILLICSGLMIRTFRALANVNPGVAFCPTSKAALTTGPAAGSILRLLFLPTSDKSEFSRTLVVKSGILEFRTDRSLLARGSPQPPREADSSKSQLR
jgi:hypothetical protein